MANRWGNSDRLYFGGASKEHASFNFMVAVTICSDFGAPQNESQPLFPYLLCHEVVGLDAMICFLNIEL